jgi:hypothetical protein
MVNYQKVVAIQRADATRVGINRWWDQVVQGDMQKQMSVITYTVDRRKSNGLILEQLETRTKNSRKIRFETRIKIRKLNRERGIAQHRAAHAI